MFIRAKIRRVIYAEWYPQPIQLHPLTTLLWSSPKEKNVAFRFEKSGVTEQFLAHSCLLEWQCPFLYSLYLRVKANAKEEGSNATVEIPIPDTAPEAFDFVLKYIYAVDNEPSFHSQSFALDVLEAADRFEIKGLKLLAESSLTYKFLCVENAAFLLLFSDSKNCPLLKEAALRLGAANRTEFVGTEAFGELKKSNDLLVELFLTESKTTKVDESVLRLREALECDGLEVDGSQATLIKRLEHHKENTEGSCPSVSE